MTSPRSDMPRAARLPFLVAIATLGAAGCDVPEFKGPQIQSPPPAFTMNPEASEQRPMFPDLPILHHDAWVEASGGNFSGIYINGHPGVLGSVEVEAARQAATAEAFGQNAEFGEIESLQVDGRTAWGWGESWRLPNGGLQYVVFRAAIPYDTITYAVDFIAGDPGLKIRPDSLRTIVASFAVGRIRWNVPLLLVAAGAVLVLVGFARSRARARAERHARIPLAKITRKEAGTPAPNGAAPAAGTPAPTRTPAPPRAEPPHTGTPPKPPSPPGVKPAG